METRLFVEGCEIVPKRGKLGITFCKQARELVQLSTLFEHASALAADGTRNYSSIGFEYRAVSADEPPSSERTRSKQHRGLKIRHDVSFPEEPIQQRCDTLVHRITL